VDLGLPDMEFDEAAAAGVKSLVVGIAPDGGALSDRWVEALASAARAGLHVVSGLHSRLEEHPSIVEAAAASGAKLINVRRLDRKLPVGTGARRSGKRVLTVGTDCALGKKYTALLLTRAMASRGVAATFRATGQTGIMIAGGGIPIDAVVADFVAGAAECLSPAADPDHWDVIEGQGALFHPSYAAVTLGLLHGSQPDAMILCHDPRRAHIDGFPDFPIPPLREAARRYEEAARLTNPSARVAGISLNTSGMKETDARQAIALASEQCGLPCTDPYRFNCDILVDAVLA
jgi:uncharacterized NAD-dependent epimerase/dehydratase family protein